MPTSPVVHMASTTQFSGTSCGRGQSQQITTVPGLVTCSVCQEAVTEPETQTSAIAASRKTHYQQGERQIPICGATHGKMVRMTINWEEVTCWRCINNSQKSFQINQGGAKRK